MALPTGPGAGASRLMPWLERLSGRLFRPSSPRELDTLPTFERRRILAGAAVGESGLAQLYHGQAHVRALLPDMIRRFGLAPGRLQEHHMAVYRDLHRTCAACPNTRRCARARRTGASAAVCREFCANAPTLEDLLEEGA